MIKTIQSRITLVLVIAMLMIGIIGGLALYSFNRTSEDINQLIKNDIRTEVSAERIFNQILQMEQLQNLILANPKKNPTNSFRPLERLSERILANIEKHANLKLVKQNQERTLKLKEIILDYKKQIDPFVSLKASEIENPNYAQLKEELDLTINQAKNLAHRISEIGRERLRKHEKQTETFISKANRNMLFFLFAFFISGVLLVFIAPRKVTAPFRRYIYALKEVEELNFDTRLPITSRDEVGQLGVVINRLLERFHKLDIIKQKRIQFEKNKQRVLANMLDLGVMLLAKEGDILSMNAQLAKILDLKTEEYQGKHFQKIELPEEVKETINEVLTNKERFDSRMMLLNYRANEKKETLEVLVDVGLVRNYQGKVVNFIITFDDITNSPGESVFRRISLTEQKLV